MPCHGLGGCFQHADVNIGWRAYRATRRTAIQTKPGAGTTLAVLDPGDGVALQSVRNPSCDPYPAPRAAVRGADGRRYVWGYSRSGAKTGWVCFEDVERDPNALAKHEANGPAREDFEVGRSVPTPGVKSGCGKLTGQLARRRRHVVQAREAHLRYSPHGTGFHYLHHGDEVRILAANGPQGQHFVEVVSAAPDGSARPGMRGWMSTSAL